MKFAEFASLATRERIDSKESIIFGVSVITIGEAKGHDLWIDSKALQQVKSICSQFRDGVKVKANHADKNTGPDIKSTIGILKNFRVDNDKVRADLHLLKSDPNCAKFIEMAETMPDNIGFSIAWTGDTEKVGEKDFIRINEIYSVDLVDSPAANTGLFSNGDDDCRYMEEEDHYSKYGDVEYADSKNHRCPINNEKHIRAAWSYINMPKNAAKYPINGVSVASVKSRIKAAAKKHGIEISDENKKSMSKELTQLLELSDDADESTILNAVQTLASKKKEAEDKLKDKKSKDDEKEGQDEEKMAAIEATIQTLSAKLDTLAQRNALADAMAEKAEIDNLLAEASRDAKVVPLSQDKIYTVKDGVCTVHVKPNLLSEIISNLPKGQVAIRRRDFSRPEKDGKALSGEALRSFCVAKQEEGARLLTEKFQSIGISKN